MNNLACVWFLSAIVAKAANVDIKAHVGTTVDLPCRVDTSLCGDLHSVKFYRETSRIYVYSHVGGISRAEGDATNRMKVEYTPTSTEALLKITPVEIQDEASYKCEITYLEVRENCDVVQIIKLTTLVKPESVRMLTANGVPMSNSSVLGPLHEGTSVEMICEAHGGRPTPLVKWFNGTEEVKATYTPVDDGDGVGSGIAKLQMSLTRGDLMARYECRVESDALDEPIVSWITTDVNVKPTNIHLSGVKNHVVQGTNVLLTCDVSGAKPAAEVKWFNNSIPITDDDYIYSSAEEMPDGTFTTKSRLVFEATRWENGNAFHCYADNTVIREQKDSSLHSVLLIEVYYPPVVSVSPSNITTNESGNILLLCTYISNPMKLEGVVWAKDGKNLTLTDDKYEGGHIDNPPLRIKNVTREDMGEYRCICQNSVPSQESHDSVFLNVQFAPIVVVNMEPSTPVKSKDKINVTLECAVASGNPSNLLKVRWFLGNELLKELPECNYTSFDENGNGEGDGGPLCDIDPSILSLEAVEETFAGNYTCQGKNIAGWGTESEPHELIVYYAPSPAKLRYSPAKVVKKSSVTLECSVDNPGRPDRIRYLWYKGVHLVPDVTTPNWTISPVTIGARSNFTCIATNEGGNSENASIFIDVSAPPAFILNLHPYQGFLMSSKNISLTCRVECSPLCSIVWFKDGQQLNFETNHLYHVKTAIYPPDLRTNDFESIESTLIWNMTAWPGEQLDRTAPNSNYICQSSHNAIGPGVNSSIEIAVDYPPENLTVSNRVVSVVENHLPEKVYCNGKGHPKLSYTWKKDDSPDFLSKTNIMTLGAVTRADSGKYVCEAINRHGAETTNVYLNVQYAPECNLETVEYAGSPALECTAHANPQEVTFLYKIKGDNDTVDASGMVQKGLKSYLPLDLGVDTFRTYQCFVNNSVGTSSPCERDVAGTVPWWKQFANENLIILVAVVVGVVICIIIICVIIVLVCRRKRASNKYNSPVEMEEREKPDGQSPETSANSRWPLKPGVLVHSTKLHNINLCQFATLGRFRSASLPKGGHRFRYDRKRNKLCARLARLKEMLGIRDQDSLPLGVYRGSTGVTFKKFKASTPNLARRDNQNPPSRKRKKPGYPPNQSSMADKGGSGAAPPSGGLADPLIDPDKGFYENLPFHGMQNAPNKPISIITPTVHTNSRPHASPSSAQLMPRPLNVSLQQQSVVRARIQRNQSFHGFQNNQNQLLVDGTTPDWMQFSNPNLMQPIFGQVQKQHWNQSVGAIRTNPNFFTTNCNRMNSFGNRGQLFGAANPFSGPARVVGRNENKLDIRRTASGINIAQKPTTDDSVGQSVKNSQDKTEIEPLKKQKKPKAFDGRAFGSLELRAHKCYSPTFYSMRCKKHAKRRPIIYAVLRRSKAPEKIKSPEAKDDYQNLTDSIQILEQNAENDKAETRCVPKAAPRCRKHRKSEIIYANVSLAPKVANMDSSNESSVHEGEISVTEVLVHKESKDLKPDDANDPKNDANEKIVTQTEQSPKPKIIDFSAKKSPGLLLKSTPTVKVSPNFIKPKVVSPKGALYMQLQARLKNSKQHASTQTAALIKESPSKDSTTQTTQTKSSQSETSPVPKMPLLDLEMHNKKKNELMCANQPYRPEFSDLDYADVDYRSYGPINYKAASIYAAMKRNQNNNKLQENDDLL